VEGFGERHNWTKKSIFWELPYWKTNLLLHNLDVMHIEKNFFDNIFNTVMDGKGKGKDNVKARMDVLEHCKRPELELCVGPNGKVVKLKAKFTFTLEQKRALCEWIKELQMPDGYASHMSNCVDMSNATLSGMKSYDCHVFMQSLLPIAFNVVSEYVWKTLAKLSQFFKDSRSTVLLEDRLLEME